MKQNPITLDGKQFVKCGHISDELGEFEILAPVSYADLNIYFFRVIENAGEAAYEEVEQELTAKLRSKYTAPRDESGIVF